ncbi:Two-pore potassium channel 5 [Acorus gramineus]|uniref:Two-pore potassium channel 5 n=1 Tax=Acorus gramineus TaxID=55184 RepID=A0AAV9BTP6_ACOGR|nr:Two-pore potassium channel 5 [Acorus gramineus]
MPEEEEKKTSMSGRTEPIPGPMIKQAMTVLLLYLALGLLVYALARDEFSGPETNRAVDALYFSVVTLCTIGYGDIAPITGPAKLFACLFVLVGFGVVDVLLAASLTRALDAQEELVLRGRARAGFARDVVVDAEKGRMRIRLKVGLALGVVVACVGTGALVLRLVEGLDWVDSVYLAVMSATTVGYGDRAFGTVWGRVFASVWLLVSTLAVARAFLYLAEARIDRRRRRMAKWVLQREVTVEDLMDANLNNNGCMRY